MIPLAYSLRNLAVRRATTLATAGGLALVVFVFSSSLMLANGVHRALGRAARDDVAIVLQRGADAEYSSSIEGAHVARILAAKQVARTPSGEPSGVAEVSGVILMDKIGADGVSNVQVRGVPDSVMSFRSDVKIVEGRPATPGTDEVIVGKALRGRFQGLDMTQSFEIRTNRPVKVVGIFEAGGASYESEVWGDIDVVRAAFGREGLVSSIRARLTSESAFDAFKAEVTQDPKDGLDVLREPEYYEKISLGTISLLQGLGVMIALLFSIGAMIGATITMHSSIAQRDREIGILHALGFSRASILSSCLIESILLALAGGVVGAVASLALGFVHFSLLNFSTWSEIVFKFEPTPTIIVSSIVLSVVMGALGGLLPAVRAARMNPVEAMRG